MKRRKTIVTHRHDLTIKDDAAAVEGLDDGRQFWEGAGHHISGSRRDRKCTYVIDFDESANSVIFDLIGPLVTDWKRTRGGQHRTQYGHRRSGEVGNGC